MANTRRPIARRGLVALNATLLLALGAVTLAPKAGAQGQPAPRPRGEYTLVGGQVMGANSNAIYVLDAANRELVTLMWDDSRKQIHGIGYRDLANDLIIDPQR